MATPQEPRRIEAVFKQIISSEKASPPSSSAPKPNTQVKRSQGRSLPQKEGGVVKDSLEIPKEEVPAQKLADLNSSGPTEDSVVRDSFDIAQNDDLHDLSPEKQASSNRIRTSQTKRSTLFDTDLTTPSMAPKSTAKSSNATKPAAKKSQSQPSRTIPPITNTGTTSSLAALRSIKAGKSVPLDEPEEAASNSKTKPPEKIITDTQARSSRKDHTQPSQNATHASQEAKRSEPIDRPSSKSQSNPLEPVRDEFALDASPERTPVKPLRDPKSSSQPSTKKAPPKLSATKKSTAKQPTASQIAAKKSATKQAATKQPDTKQPGASKTSAEKSAPKRRVRPSQKSNVRVEDSDVEAGYTEAKPSKSGPTAPARSTRAKTRAQTKDDPADDSAMAQLPAARSRKKPAGEPSQQNVKIPRATFGESYGEFEDSVTNLHNNGLAETAETPEEVPGDRPVKRHHNDLVAQVEIKKEKVESSQKLLDQSSAKRRERKASTKRAPPVITIEDDDNDGDEDNISEDGDDPSPSGSITHDDEDGEEEHPRQNRSSVQTPAAAKSSPPEQPRHDQTAAFEQDALAKEHAEHKPNIVGFSKDGPRNQGSLPPKGTAKSRPRDSQKSLFDRVEDYVLSGNESNGQAYIPQPGNYSAAEILKNKLDTPRKEQYHPVYMQNEVDLPRKSIPPTKRLKDTEPAVPKLSMTVPTPSEPPIMTYVGSTKRSNPDDIGGPTKRPKLFDDAKVRPQRVEARTTEKGALRKSSQHTVTDEGSPIFNGTQQPKADTSPVTTVLHKPGKYDLPSRQAVRENLSSFFPMTALSQQATQRNVPAVHDQEPVTMYQQLRQASAEMESQAISHAQSDELIEDIVEEADETDVQEHPFAEIQEPRMSGKQAPHGLMDVLRSKVEKETPKEPENDHSDASQEGTEDVDEDDPDKTLVNEDSDDDSAGSFDTNVEQDRHHDELAEWRNALSLRQGEVHDALIRVAHGFTMHLVDHETAIGDIISDFVQDGGKIVKQLEDRHEAELQEYAKQVLLAKKNLIRGFKLTEDSLFEDLEEIKASSDHYKKIQQKQVDPRKRLDQIEAAYF